MLTLMTMNAANYDDHPGWLDRLGYIADTIVNSGANVVCMSEIRYTAANPFNSYAPTYWANQGLTPPPNPASMADQIITLLVALTGQPWVAITKIAMEYNGPEQWEGLCVMSPLAMTDGGTFSMPTGDGNQRITQIVDLTTPVNNAVTIYNTHFALDAASRLADAQTLVQNVSGTVFLIAGDMNSEPNDPAVAVLQSAGYVDLWAGLQPNDAGYTFASPSPVKRIDYIWASPQIGAAQSIATVPPSSASTPTYTTSDAGTLFASDHLGLCAVFDI